VFPFPVFECQKQCIGSEDATGSKNMSRVVGRIVGSKARRGTRHLLVQSPLPKRPNSRVRQRCRTPKYVSTAYTSAIAARNLRSIDQMRPRTRNVRGHCSSQTSQNVGPAYLMRDRTVAALVSWTNWLRINSISRARMRVGQKISCKHQLIVCASLRRTHLLGSSASLFLCLLDWPFFNLLLPPLFPSFSSSACFSSSAASPSRALRLLDSAFSLCQRSQAPSS